MTTDSSAPAVAAMSSEACWRLLADHHLARLAVSVADQPEIFPLNYVVQSGTLLFRTAPGTKLAALTVNEAVVLEIDGHDDASGWSVIVKGHAQAVDWGPDLDLAETAGLRPWVATDKPVFVRVHPTSVTGRAFRFGPEPELF